MKNLKPLLAAIGILVAGVLPTVASADHWHDRHRSRRDSGDGWRDLTILGGVVGLAGVATHNSTVAAIGLGGALYSGARYENDRASHYDGGYYRGGYGYDRRHHDGHRGYGHRGW